MSDINTALKTLWNTGLSPHHYNTIELAAQGAADIIKSLRDHLDSPPPDVQEKVLAMRGTNEHGYHQDAASEVLAEETEDQKCTWTEDENGNWLTECGRLWALIEGSPAENGMEWCPMCGRKLEVE